MHSEYNAGAISEAQSNFQRMEEEMASQDPLTPMWPLPFVLFFTLLMFLLRKKLESVKRQKNQQLPPGPPKLPIIGNLHQLGDLPHQSLWKLSKKYGSVMLLKLGSVPTVVISSADAAKEVLKSNDLNTCSRPLLVGTGRLSYNYLDVSFTPYGDYWRNMRKICVLELFSARRVQSFRFIREEEVALLTDSISTYSSAATPVDLGEKILSLTANITCRAAFGKSFREIKGFDGERFEEIIREASGMLASFSASDFFPYVGWIVDRLTGLHSRLERSFKELDVFYQRIIDDHIKLEEEQENEDIVGVLLKLQRDQTEFPAIQLTQEHIKATLMNIFLAGVDTGAIALVWAMAELAKNPRVMKNAQEEIRNCIGKRSEVSESDIDGLGYLKMVLKETLRLHPPSTLLLPREAMFPFKIKGYHINPKTRIVVNAWAIGRDAKIWRNPEEFIPERFIDSSIDFKGQHYELLPFGAGRRGCPGIYMGMSMVELALANLLFCFDWKLPGGMKEEDINMEELAALTTFKKSALLLVPIKYQPKN